jgi:hypothetical protein
MRGEEYEKSYLITDTELIGIYFSGTKNNTLG